MNNRFKNKILNCKLMKYIYRINYFWLLIIPYISKTILIVLNEIFVELNLENTLILFVIFGFLLFSGKVIKKLNSKLKSFIYALTIVCLYYKLMLLEHLVFFNSIKITIVSLTVAISIIIYLFRKNLKKGKVVFSTFIVLYSLLILASESTRFVLPVKKNIHLNNNNNKIIFIILDEYSSPSDLFNNFSDTNIYYFSKYLKRRNWIVYDEITSANTQTLKSISSIFNFGFKTMDQENNIYSINLLKNSKLINLLEKENYYILNLSFLQIGKYKETQEVFFKYPKNILEVLIYNSIFFELIRKNGISTPESYNIETIEKVNNIKILKEKYFVYIHLLMPHPPFFFKNEINVIKQNDYLKFWKFTNQKMIYTISKIQENNKDSKIIIMGDHGYRGNEKINANKTFLALYGFESSFKEKKSQEVFKILLDSIKN